MAQSLYHNNVNNRSFFRYIIGLYPRLKKSIFFRYVRYIAIKNGAIIGNNTIIPLALAKRANNNLIVGNNTSIQTDIIDLRAPVKIGSHVIIGHGVEILTCSHNIDSEEWEFKSYGVEIYDYAWIATKAFILPSCRKLGRGSVCAAGSVVAQNVEPMSIVVGNPASHLRFRKVVHSNLIVESLLGADFQAYKRARIK